MALSTQEESVTYYPRVFDVASEAHAKGIILTPEGSQPTHERWIKETPYLADLILQYVKLDKSSLVLDYGCGIGRLAKELIARTGCMIIGVDISNTMIGYAAPYVNSPSFSAITSKVFERLVDEEALVFDFAFSVWVLQHSVNPERDIKYISFALRQESKFFVVNDITRKVPTLERGWVDDGLDIQEIITASNDLSSTFKELKVGKLDPRIVPKEIHESCFWGLYVG